MLKIKSRERARKYNYGEKIGRPGKGRTDSAGTPVDIIVTL
jgi:hypothetical protein